MLLNNAQFVLLFPPLHPKGGNQKQAIRYPLLRSNSSAVKVEVIAVAKSSLAVYCSSCFPQLADA